MNRRSFIKNSAIFIGGLSIAPSWPFTGNSLQFGWVTDIHYALAPVKWGRYYQENIVKLKEAVHLFNEKKVDFAIETGDFKDQTDPPVEHETLEYLKQVEAEFARYKGSRYHVLGNHDVDSLSKSQFLHQVENTGIDQDKSFYYFEKKGFRFVVLDACFKSDGKEYDHDNFDYRDTNIPEQELEWLSVVLKDSTSPVIVFVHQRLDGEGDLFINNSKKVRRVLEESNKVVAVFQGHDHKGGAQVINGVLYYTLKAMVEGTGKENSSYAIVTINANGEVIVEGYRKAENYEYAPNKQEAVV